MRRICVLTVLTATMPAVAYAALEPHYQRQRELAAIIADEEVARQLREAPIESIMRVSEDRYEVRAGACRLLADIIGTGTDADGPRVFKVEAGDAVCED